MRKPEDIPGLGDVQVDAYYKSFLKALDESDANLTDWEAEFVGSNLGRVAPLSDKQIQVVRRLMDKHYRIYPKFAHYRTKKEAEEFLSNWA